MRFVKPLLLLAASALGAATAGAASPPLPLLPMPASIVSGSGQFALRGVTLATSSDRGVQAAIARFRDLLSRSGGPDLPLGANGQIRFVRDPKIAGVEAYRLEVTPKAVTIRASGNAGLFYGAETLWQLTRKGAIPCVTIADRPAMAWRGLMLDSVRHFQPVSYVETLLDRMAEAKLNTFHWHLTDDQGWRIPIDRYPRLAAVGGWRVPAGASGRDPKTGKPVTIGGVYTKDEIRHVVAYAAARHITVVPEIEMPGHATSAIAAYPELASTASPPKTPSSEWGVLPNLFNTKDSTFTFLENVLDEVMALFPGRYIHVGGDEAPKDQWKSDPTAQARIKALGLKDENALQGWFTARIGAYLEKHGRRLVGWDEILEGGVPADATVMSWHGLDGAIAAAKAGHDAILAPMPMMYLDNRQSNAADETPGRGDIVDWKRIYAFNPTPTGLTPDQARHIVGIQANLWVEHARTLKQTERMTWPRAAEVAELGWSPAMGRDWNSFVPRLVGALDRWRTLGWGYDTVPLEPEARAGLRGASLAQPAGIGTIRYTTDGSVPSPTSPAYIAFIPRNGTLNLAAQTFLGERPLGTVRRWTFDENSAFTRPVTQMKLCADKLPLRLEDDEPGDVRPIHWVDIMEACWIWPKAPVDAIRRISADVGSVPFNFSLGADMADVTSRTPATPEGELEIRQDSCTGPRIAVLPLAPAAGRAGETTLKGDIAPTSPGAHDLCMTFTQKGADPLWVIDRLTLERGQ